MGEELTTTTKEPLLALRSWQWGDGSWRRPPWAGGPPGGAGPAALGPLSGDLPRAPLSSPQPLGSDALLASPKKTLFQSVLRGTGSGCPRLSSQRSGLAEKAVFRAFGFLKTQCLWAPGSQTRAGLWDAGSGHRLAILEMAGTGIFSLCFQLEVELICERTSSH